MKGDFRPSSHSLNPWPHQAISGGQIAEALLDLTGAPTMTIDFSDDSFNSELLWRQLLAFKSQRLPMGCGTSPDPDLKEVGLDLPHCTKRQSPRP